MRNDPNLRLPEQAADRAERGRGGAKKNNISGVLDHFNRFKHGLHFQLF